MNQGFSREEKQIIDRIAEEALVKFHYEDGKDIYVDAVRLANFFGFRVCEEHMPFIQDGRIENGAHKLIAVNFDRGIESKRLIIATGLSRCFLYADKDAMSIEYGRREERRDVDSATEYMARCLLMPKESFQKEYAILKHRKMDIAGELRHIFRIPIWAVEKRVDELCKRQGKSRIGKSI